ncbi:MAG: hypothetical protein FJ190_12980 [Gammaproteobacteria bacterium]|nr:hypothetical protein [Gammaproteobacteria bacterium]
MKLQHLIFAVALTTAGMPVFAETLANVGPNDPVSGFPTYYQDNGDGDVNAEPLALDLCLPNKIPADMSELTDGSCVLLPGDIPDETQPISFSDNFPGEAFYYNAQASMPLTGGVGTPKDAILIMAVEAAFANEQPVQGDQMVFARLRYRFNAPLAGDYTIETPYKTDDPMHLNSGELAFITEDIGVNCAQGDFSCALAGSIAPFLRTSTSEGGTPLPLHEAHGNKYLAAPGIDTFVTGSPINHNFFRILYQPDSSTAPTVIGSTNQFQLMAGCTTVQCQK